MPDVRSDFYRYLHLSLGLRWSPCGRSKDYIIAVMVFSFTCEKFTVRNLAVRRRLRPGQAFHAQP